MATPFAKDSSFLIRSSEPFNGGPAPGHVRNTFITPVGQFFVRAHAVDVPQVEVGTFSLDVGGLVRSPLNLSLDQLRSKFKTQRLVATMQCAGNRRDQLMAIAPVPGEVPWGAEAISNGEWEGVRLSDVLDAAGVDEAPREKSSRAGHVEFIGLDQITKAGQTFGFGGSIELEKARSPEVLIAWAMNGKPLEPIHGFPLRAVVPGYLGARSVKWLKQINVLAKPSANFFQAHAYKMFPPDVRPETADWNAGVMLGEFAVTSAITSPEAGQRISAGMSTIAGWATGSAGKNVARVEVSTDGGQSWTAAKLVDSPAANEWTWRFWEARIPLSAGKHQIVARAFDSAGNAQPADAKALWNFKGYMNNAWHRVELKVR